MSRVARIVVCATALALLLLACGQPKETGLPSGPTKEPKPVTNIEVVDSAFKPAALTVKTGIEVTWEFVGSAPHNVKFAKLKLDSHPDCNSGGTGCSTAGVEPFKTKFSAAGSYLYYCVVHGSAAGAGMAGTITVEAA